MFLSESPHVTDSPFHEVRAISAPMLDVRGHLPRRVSPLHGAAQLICGAADIQAGAAAECVEGARGAVRTLCWGGQRGSIWAISGDASDSRDWVCACVWAQEYALLRSSGPRPGCL